MGIFALRGLFIFSSLIDPGLLYGELARVVLRLLGIIMKPKEVHLLGGKGLMIVSGNETQNYIKGPNSASRDAWDSVWGNNFQYYQVITYYGTDSASLVVAIAMITTRVSLDTRTSVSSFVLLTV
ncbi:unnamed protein product [Fraxinus pennsylvanica]|uniref:Uncharacterized protein n=1 Tax=Fraxinus pennsylvanica TaxID=56036 RepID=A0AAD1ZBM1_9LAMI|nr:unnamed protein product [Fraxinus pennsylvanica]